MVKNSFKFYFLVPLIGIACFAGACRVDLLGFFGSTDLSKRLDEKDNFTFLDRYNALPRNWGDEYSFIVLADVHIEDGDAWGLEKLKDVVDNNHDIRFVAIAGDITQNASVQDLNKFIEIADDLALSGVPCYPVIGNHDIYFGNWSSWRDLIGSSLYRIDSDDGNTTLLIMDSANAYFGKDQLDWLEKQLNSAGNRTFVFTHANPFIKSPLELQQFTDTTERARFMSLLKGRCDYMFTGHVHERVIEEAGGVKYITVEDFIKKQVYCLVSVKPDGIAYEFRKL